MNLSKAKKNNFKKCTIINFWNYNYLIPPTFLTSLQPLSCTPSLSLPPSPSLSLFFKFMVFLKIVTLHTHIQTHTQKNKSILKWISITSFYLILHICIWFISGLIWYWITDWLREKDFEWFLASPIVLDSKPFERTFFSRFPSWHRRAQRHSAWRGDIEAGGAAARLVEFVDGPAKSPK